MNNKAFMGDLAKILIKKEVIEGKEFEKLFAKKLKKKTKVLAKADTK